MPNLLQCSGARHSFDAGAKSWGRLATVSGGTLVLQGDDRTGHGKAPVLPLKNKPPLGGGERELDLRGAKCRERR